MEILLKLGLVDNPAGTMAVMARPAETHQVPIFMLDGQPALFNVQATPVSSTPDVGCHLMDGRGYAWITIEPTEWFAHEEIPSRRPLWAIVNDITTHGMMNPDHGTGCICMDAYAREIKQHVNRGLPFIEDDSPEKYRSSEWAVQFDARARVCYVLHMVTRSL